MWAVELRREESRGRLEDLVGPTQLRVLLLQRLQLLRLRGRRPRPDTGVHLRLPHPLAQRLGSRDPQLCGDRSDRLVLRGIVLTVLPHQRDRALTQLRRVLRGTCHETSSFQTNEVSRHPGVAHSSARPLAPTARGCCCPIRRTAYGSTLAPSRRRRAGDPPWGETARSHLGAPIGVSPAAQLAWAYDRCL